MSEVTRTVLFGGTDFTVSIAEALIATGLPIAGVVTVERTFDISYSPGRPVVNARYADVQTWASKHDVPCLVYSNAEEVRKFITESRSNLGIVAGWYHLVDAATRALLPKGCLGLHSSLLPKLRGGAPLSWAILSGASETGISLFELTDGVDDGPLYGQVPFPVSQNAVVADLIELATAGAIELVSRCLPEISAGRLTPQPQTGQPSYTLQRTPEDGRIDWRSSAINIERLVRASGKPYAGAFSSLNGHRIGFWKVEVVTDGPHVMGVAGQIARIPGKDRPLVLTGDGLVTIEVATDEDGADVVPQLMRSANQRFHL